MATAKSSRLREVLQRRGMTIRQLADRVGRSVRSIHNVSCGNSQSVRLRQAISNCLSANIWEDVFSDTVILTLSVNSEFADLSEREISELRTLFPDSTETVGSNVRFVRPSEVTFDFRTRNAEPSKITETQGAMKEEEERK